MLKKEKKSLEQILLDSKAITKEQADSINSISRKSGKSFKEAITASGILAEGQLSLYIAEQIGVSYIDLKNYIIHPDVIAIIPETTAKKYKVIPIFKIKNFLTVAMIDPLDFHAIDALKNQTKCAIRPVMADPSSIDNMIERYYGISGSVEQLIEELDLQALIAEIKKKQASPEHIRAVIDKAPVIKLVDLIIEDGVRKGASDIHIEPKENNVSIRLRIDGILHEGSSLPKILQEAVISRIKVLAELDIAQKRIPQDGKIRIKTAGRNIDIRVSTYPNPFGEDVVLRILDKTNALLSLQKLGFSTENLQKIHGLLNAPNGIILVTGPTGSGKTTTLYSGLNTINTPDKKIITIEDPIEYEIPGIRQSQINPKAGFTFASGLRSILRHDPDVIMVGEIRDMETAEIAVHSALTGHLVLSTLHTNDAPSAIARLIDMGIEPYLIPSSLLGVIAQRLVRVICSQCRELYQPPPTMLEQLKLPKTTRFYRGRGCNYCRGTGYSGRVMVSEVLILTNPLKEEILKKSSSVRLGELASKEGMITMREDGIHKCIEGITSIEEVMRVT